MNASPREKSEQFLFLAREYLNLAESGQGASNARLFVYLHALELLLKAAVFGQGTVVPEEVEFTHDFAVLARALNWEDESLTALRELDPRGIRYRYPGADFRCLDAVEFQAHREQTLAAWCKLQRFLAVT